MADNDVLRVLLADDHEGFRQELRETLQRYPDVDVVDTVANGADAVRRVQELRPGGLDLVLMDIDMPVMDGIAATREILARDPKLAIIILTVSTMDRDLFSGIALGAVGFLNKTLSPGSMIRTLRDFRANGSLPMSRVMAAKAVAYLRQQRGGSQSVMISTTENLSSREQEVLQGIATGAHDREIAAKLLVAETTIKTHVRQILRKLGARNRAEAVAHLRRSDSA